VTEPNFTELGVAEPLRRALEAEGYARPTPIQAQAIPLLLEGRDLLGIAQTGTGKTAAFALPILQRLAAGREPAGPRSASALVLAPTRELALQISESFRTYGRHTGLRQAAVYGGVGYEKQIQALARGVDVLIACPGRLLDLLEQRKLRLDRTPILVLDEADQMLDMGFIRSVRKIISAMPGRRQTMLFSATMPESVAGLAAEILREPARVQVSPSAIMVDQVEQRVFFVGAQEKRALLSRLLKEPEMGRVLVFTRTKHGANRVTGHLADDGIAAEALHGNKSQGARQRALDMFRAGRLRVLVATDVASRGIDITDVTHVINFELPNVPEIYVHRVGRTARAGASGIALSFCDPQEQAFLRDIERLTKRPLAVAGGQPSRAVPAAAPKARPQRPARGARPKARPHARPQAQAQAQDRPPAAAAPSSSRKRRFRSWRAAARRAG